MADEKLSEKFYEVSVRLAEARLDEVLDRCLRDCFRIAKSIVQDVAAGKKPMDELRKTDELVRFVFADRPRDLAEWEEIMRDFDLSQDVVDDGK